MLFYLPHIFFNSNILSYPVIKNRIDKHKSRRHCGKSMKTEEILEMDNRSK